MFKFCQSGEMSPNLVTLQEVSNILCKNFINIMFLNIGLVFCLIKFYNILNVQKLKGNQLHSCWAFFFNRSKNSKHGYDDSKIL